VMMVEKPRTEVRGWGDDGREAPDGSPGVG